MKDTNKAMQVFGDLFRGRTDVYGSYRCGDQLASGFQVKKQITNREIGHHLLGLVPLGIYPLLEDNTTRWICVDFDDQDFGPERDFYDSCKHCDITPAIGVSKSKRYHAWIFFDKPIPAAKARLVILNILSEIKSSKEETRKGWNRNFEIQNWVSIVFEFGFGDLPN
jgi:hypothetical protein